MPPRIFSFFFFLFLLFLLLLPFLIHPLHFPVHLFLHCSSSSLVNYIFFFLFLLLHDLTILIYFSFSPCTFYKFSFFLCFPFFSFPCFPCSPSNYVNLIQTHTIMNVMNTITPECGCLEVAKQLACLCSRAFPSSSCSSLHTIFSVKCFQRNDNLNPEKCIN